MNEKFERNLTAGQYQIRQTKIFPSQGNVAAGWWLHSMSAPKELIIRMKCSVLIDQNSFKENTFTRESVRNGNPTVIKNEHGDFCVAIYSTLCGVLDTKSSQALQILSREGIEKQVGSSDVLVGSIN